MFQQKAEDGTMSGADQLDLEAAEQLIQLSGGSGDDGVSESRSADSVKCCGPDQAGAGEKEVAVESRRRSSAGRFVAGTCCEADRKSAESINKRSRAAGKDEPAVESRRRSGARFRAGKNGAGVVDGGEERRRPRFRWLADIYRERGQLTTGDPRAAGGSGPPEAGERKRKRKRAAGAADEAVVPVASKASKERTMVA